MKKCNQGRTFSDLNFIQNYKWLYLWKKKFAGLCFSQFVRIRSYSFPYFPAFGLNTDQNDSEFEHFLRSAYIFNIKQT